MTAAHQLDQPINAPSSTNAPTTVVSPATRAATAFRAVARWVAQKSTTSVSHTSNASAPSKPDCFNDSAVPANNPDAKNQTRGRCFDNASTPTARPAADTAPLNSSVFAAKPSSTGAADTTAHIIAADRAATSPAISRTTTPVDTTNKTPNSIAMIRIEPVFPPDIQSQTRNNINSPWGRSTNTSR